MCIRDRNQVFSQTLKTGFPGCFPIELQVIEKLWVFKVDYHVIREIRVTIWVIFLEVPELHSFKNVLRSHDFVFIFPVLRPKMSFEKCQTKGLISRFVTLHGILWNKMNARTRHARTIEQKNMLLALSTIAACKRPASLIVGSLFSIARLKQRNVLPS